jgi:hypothetical protein
MFAWAASLFDERLRLGVGYKPVSPLASWLPNIALLMWASGLRYFGLPRHQYGVRVPYYGDEQQDLLSAMCPASGKRAENGARCPAGGGGGDAALDNKARMVPKWTDNEPHYMKPLPASSIRGMIDRLFVKPNRRWGAKRWQSAGVGDDKSETPSYGYRLEECGPKGLEQMGREEVRSEAEKLTGHALSGPWAF